mmetsp:Transcript_43155/g.69432  ORF Transcript_43155/g.69432 Transcript_43155/m.69432 type:complete len:226 (+) Transcript_43155:2878-3555(+)
MVHVDIAVSLTELSNGARQQVAAQIHVAVAQSAFARPHTVGNGADEIVAAQIDVVHGGVLAHGLGENAAGALVVPMQVLDVPLVVPGGDTAHDCGWHRLEETSAHPIAVVHFLGFFGVQVAGAAIRLRDVQGVVARNADVLTRGEAVLGTRHYGTTVLGELGKRNGALLRTGERCDGSLGACGVRLGSQRVHLGRGCRDGAARGRCQGGRRQCASLHRMRLRCNF